jgi:hypothetical protein
MISSSGLPRLLELAKGKGLPAAPNPGQEAVQLRKLLGLYQRWSGALLPGMPFGEFIARAAKGGGGRLVSRALDAIREGKVGEDITVSARLAPHSSPPPAEPDAGDSDGPDSADYDAMRLSPAVRARSTSPDASAAKRLEAALGGGAETIDLSDFVGDW